MYSCDDIAGSSQAQESGDQKKDSSWASGVGLQRGLPPAALTWALLSGSQEALLTHAIKQVSFRHACGISKYTTSTPLNCMLKGINGMSHVLQARNIHSCP